MLRELLRFRRAVKRNGRSRSTGNYLLDGVEISGAHETLVLDRLVAYWFLAREFFLLQPANKPAFLLPVARANSNMLRFSA